jgi:putative tryptophan/tyrosine transport system substrate-binding protein
MIAILLSHLSEFTEGRRHMNRRMLLIAFGVGALAAPLGPLAQQPLKPNRVAWLSNGSLSGNQEFIDDLKTALRDLGYREGKNIVFDFRYAEGKPERLPGLATEIVALKPDVVVTGATPGTRAAKEATATIPIVMIGVSDPIGAGFVASLAHPGGNITGVANLGLDMAAKPLELLHTVVPKATRIAVLLPDNPSIPAILRGIQEAARGLGLTLLPITVSTPDEIEGAFASMSKEKAEALIVVADTVTMLNRKRIAELAAGAKLPAIYQYLAQVEAGGLFSYGPNPRNLHKIVASYIDKILKGANPADLPVQQPTEFELVVNMKTAKALGITFPPEILLRADKVVEQ